MKYNNIPVLYLIENVFFPDTIIPLSLTDEVSKALVKECYQNDKKFALYSTHPKSLGVATIGKILIIDDKKDKENDKNSSLTIVIQGIERIQLSTITQHIPYPIFKYHPYPDSREPQILKEGSLERLFSIFDQWIHRHVTSENERNIFLKEVNTPQKLVFNIALFMIKDIELKLLFLESTSLSDRINILDALLTGEKPESEDRNRAEAIKNFERLEVNSYKNVVN
jgi:ATP-dependent Lon protease